MIGIDAHNHFRPFCLSIAEGCIALGDATHGPINRIQMHRRKHRRQLGAVFHMLCNRLVAEMVSLYDRPLRRQRHEAGEDRATEIDGA